MSIKDVLAKNKKIKKKKFPVVPPDVSSLTSKTTKWRQIDAKPGYTNSNRRWEKLRI